MKQIWTFREGEQAFVTYADTDEQIQTYWNKTFGVAARFIRVWNICNVCDNKRERNWCSGRLGGCDCDCHVWDWRKPIELSPISAKSV